MGWNRLDFAVANHEATHAVIGAVLGLEVGPVSIDGPIVHQGEDLDGLAIVRSTISRRSFKKRLAATMAPWISTGVLWDYPPRPENGGDEAVASVLVDVFDISAGEWHLIVHAVEEMLRLQSVRDALAQVGGELLENGTVSGERVVAIVDLHLDSRPPSTAT